MVAMVVGTRYINFTDSKTNNVIAGTKVHCVIDSDDEGIKGQLVDSVFVREGSKVSLPEFVFGQKYDFIYEQMSFNSRPVLVDIKPVGKADKF